MKGGITAHISYFLIHNGYPDFNGKSRCHAEPFDWLRTSYAKHPSGETPAIHAAGTFGSRSQP